LNAIAEDKTGNIWIGSVKGLFKLNPSLETNTKIRFKPLLTSFKIFLQDTVIQDNIELPHYLNHINFSFTAVDYRNPESIQYRYILHGLTKIWSTTKSDNGVEFSKLNPGKYTLEVIAVNADGEESESLIYNFTIRPPFYKTWWFLILVNIAAIAAIYFFIKWRISQLEKTKRILEQMVKERTAELQKEKQIVEEQNKLIEEKNKDITDSIVYAKRIQEAVLPGKIILEKYLPDSFVMYYPRDIVSGDFYWFNQIENKFICIVADATGHGVPGAFMSMIGNTAFNEIINEKKIIVPNQILNNLHNIVRDALKKDEYAVGEIKTYDGMDVAVCVYDKSNGILEYAGANRPLLYVEDGEIVEIKPDKISINSPSHPNATFTNNQISIRKRTCFYMFSDGITDQFGGEKGKKFLTKQVKDIIQENYQLSLPEQFTIFEKRVNDWKSGYQQIDDQLLIGFAVEIQ
jgi:serine phosphatase RsbU (regulator of sigma subunit)